MKSKYCPNCGSDFGWKDLGESNGIKLELMDHRWRCLNCLDVWIDSDWDKITKCKPLIYGTEKFDPTIPDKNAHRVILPKRENHSSKPKVTRNE